MDFDIEIFPNIHFTSWRILWIIALPVQLANLLILWYLPESPKYYLSVGKEEKAMKVLERIAKLNKGKTLSELGITGVIQIDVATVDESKRFLLKFPINLSDCI